MVKIQNKLLILSVLLALVNLLAVGCFFASQSLTNNHHHDGMSTPECCSIGPDDSSEHVGYGLQYNTAATNYLPLNLGFLAFLILIVYLKDVNFLNYYIIKDRYGGFRLFYKFILLFKKGIIHPKIY